MSVFSSGGTGVAEEVCSRLFSSSELLCKDPRFCFLNKLLQILRSKCIPSLMVQEARPLGIIDTINYMKEGVNISK